MGQSDGYNQTLRRIALQIRNGGFYYFQVNPEDYSHTQGQRTTAMKSKTDIIIEDFGKDIEVITFSGTTGWKKDKNGKTGADRVRLLQEFIGSYASKGGSGNNKGVELIFHNFTDNHSYVVHLAPEGISVSRNVDRPILYDYKINLIVLRDANTPPPDERDTVNSGNYKPSIDTSGVQGRVTTPNINSVAPLSLNSTHEIDSIMGNNMRSKLNTSGIDTPYINPRVTKDAYKYGVEELISQIGYGEG